MEDTQSVVVPSPFTKHHKDISQLMLEQVINQITMALKYNTVDIKSYSVNESSWSGQTEESISIKVNDKTCICLKVQRDK